MNFIKAINVIEKLTHATTGGHTRCKHANCDCLIKNEDYDNNRGTKRSCPACNHPYDDHDIFN